MFAAGMVRVLKTTRSVQRLRHWFPCHHVSSIDSRYSLWYGYAFRERDVPLILTRVRAGYIITGLPPCLAHACYLWPVRARGEECQHIRASPCYALVLGRSSHPRGFVSCLNFKPSVG